MYRRGFTGYRFASSPARERATETAKDVKKPPLLAWASGARGRAPASMGCLAPSRAPAAHAGRVENRLSPVLPHQTVHALLTHTAF